MPSIFVGSAQPANILPVKNSFDAGLLQLGVAGYSFLNCSVDQSIAIMQRVAINAMSLKDFYLPLDSSQEKIDELLSKFKSASISIYGVGVIYMKSENEVDHAFDYAKKVGVNLIICSPAYDLLRHLEQRVRSTGIRAAIHNHGPEDKLYPGPNDVYERIKDLDRGVGMCLDIGHSMRAGVDPAKAVIMFGNRIFDLHIKDVSVAAPGGKSIEVGRGVIDFSSLINNLRKIDYKGRCSFEYENIMKDPLPGIAESEGYFRGVENALVRS